MLALRFIKWSFFLSASAAYTMCIGNPADPALFEKGILSKYSCLSLRLGVMGDWVYKQRFAQEFFLLDEEVTHTKNKMITPAGIAVLNILKRLDLYTLLGTSEMQIDDQIYSKSEFSWCIGIKAMLLKHHNFFLGADAKYFETNQKPLFFVIEGAPFNIVNDYRSKCFDIQAAFGMAYRIALFVPYINATYIYSHITPEPPVVAVRFPDSNEFADLRIPSLVPRKLWGMAVGFSLVDSRAASLGFEWRLINQNGININGQIRF